MQWCRYTFWRTCLRKPRVSMLAFCPGGTWKVAVLVPWMPWTATFIKMRRHWCFRIMAKIPSEIPRVDPFSSQVSAEEKYHTFTSCAALNSAALKYGSLLTDAGGCCWILCETKWTAKNTTVITFFPWAVPGQSQSKLNNPTFSLILPGQIPGSYFVSCLNIPLCSA